MSVTVLQVVAGILRPDAESNIRPIFNWGHWFMGKSAHILSGTVLLGNIWMLIHITDAMFYLSLVYKTDQIHLQKRAN